MASSLSRQRAARAWCTPETEKIEMVPELAEAFADILDEIWGKPWLGNATNKELLDELSTRIEVHGPGLDYSTTNPPNKGIKPTGDSE